MRPVRTMPRAVPVTALAIFLSASLPLAHSFGGRPGTGQPGAAAAPTLITPSGDNDVLDQFPNPCPEGQYFNLLVAACEPLLRPELGFDRQMFLQEFQDYASNVYELKSCTESELDAAIESVQNDGGGIVVIPECTLLVNRKFHLPSNFILRGKGDQSRIEVKAGFDTIVFEAERSKNTVIQDLSLVGAGSSGRAILIWYSQNALVERVTVDSFGREGIGFRYSQGVTVRYSTMRNVVEHHGIASKDCAPEDPDVPDIEECIQFAGNLDPYGTLWSRNYAVYSNYALNNGDYGINLHAEDGEVAGNISSGNTRAGKFPDAMNVLIHHNLFEGGTTGIRVYSAYEISDRRVHDVVFYENEFRIPEEYTIRSGGKTVSLYVINNTYTAQDMRIIRNKGDSVYICPGSPEVGLEYEYWGFRFAEAPICEPLGFLTLFQQPVVSGYYVLDGFGGVHAGGDAPSMSPATPYFSFDVARNLELATTGFYVLDGYGGVHAGGDAPSMSPATPYFGFDVARDFELATPGCYVLDGYGSVHAGGGAPVLSPSTPYFGFDVAKDLELTSSGFYVLDGYGGVHAGGGAPPVTPATTYFGFDIARDLELTPAGCHVLDGFGGVHTGGSTPALSPPTPYFGFDTARDMEVAGQGFYVLDGLGAVHPGGDASSISPPTPYFGFDIAKDLELY